MADTKRTQTEVLALLADNVTGDISPQDLRDSVVSARANQGGGWAAYLEGTAVSQGTAQEITASSRTQILNDGASANTIITQIQDMPTPWHDNYLDVESNCFYNVRLTFKGQIASGSGGHYLVVELDDGVRTIWSGIDLFAKGAGTEHAFQYAIPMYAINDIVTNGGKFYITTSTATDIWGCSVLINRTYSPDN